MQCSNMSHHVTHMSYGKHKEMTELAVCRSPNRGQHTPHSCTCRHMPQLAHNLQIFFKVTWTLPISNWQFVPFTTHQMRYILVRSFLIFRYADCSCISPIPKHALGMFSPGITPESYGMLLSAVLFAMGIPFVQCQPGTGPDLAPKPD